MLYTKTIKYPITFNLISGKTDLSDYTDSINQCIGLILTTGKGELLGDPNFGSRLYEMLFEQYSDTLQNQIKEEIVDSITAFEKRVSVSMDDVTIEQVENADRNKFHITIHYEVYNNKKTGTYSFYMEEVIS